MSFKWLIQAKHVKILSVMHLVCEKHKRGSFLTFWKFLTVANMAMSLAVSLYMFLGRMQHRQGHGRVPARVQTADHQKTHQNSFFDVATLAIKAITLIHIQMLNYNTCNPHFKYTKQLKMITTFATINILKHHIHNSCKYQHE